MIKKKWDMFAESVSMSLSNIAGNKMRTFLTTLGIIIGVGAIIALMTVVQGATDTMNAQFDAMGLGTLRVSVAGTAIKHGLTDDDLQTILDCEHVAGISPSLNATVTAKRGNMWSDSISVNGNNDEYFRHNPDLLRRGRAIDVLDVENNARVCLMDGDAAKTLFFGEDPVGQTFYLDGFEYTVVGMIDEDENASLFRCGLRQGKCSVERPRTGYFRSVLRVYRTARRKSCWAPPPSPPWRFMSPIRTIRMRRWTNWKRRWTAFSMIRITPTPSSTWNP